MSDAAKQYLAQEYTRVFEYDSDPVSGGYTGKILEFPGCVTEGDDLKEVQKRLERAAENWIDAALALGQEIPKPGIIEGLPITNQHKMWVRKK